MKLVAGSIRAVAGTAAIVALVGSVVVAAKAATVPEASTPLATLSEACAATATETHSLNALFRCFYKATLLVSRAAQHQVAFETRDSPDRNSASSFGDAVESTGKALLNVGARAGGQAALARIDTVAFAIGRGPSASLSGGMLTITIVPSIGSAGRPSAEEIEQAALAPTHS